MAKSQSSTSSQDTDDEIVIKLRSAGLSEECVKKYKATSKHLQLELTRKKIATSQRLCDGCSKVNGNNIRAGFEVSKSFHHLKQSSTTCQLCYLVFMSIRSRVPEIMEKLENWYDFSDSPKASFKENGETDVEEFQERGYGIQRLLVPLHETFDLSLKRGMDGIIQVRAEVAEFNSSFGLSRFLLIYSLIRIYTKNENASLGLSIPLDPRPRGYEKFNLMKNLLKDAMESTSKPFTPAGSGPENIPRESLPSRLIYLPPGLPDNSRQLRLVDCASILDDGNSSANALFPLYVTLSHRWGLVHSFTTTRENVARRQSGFSLHDLPLTYRDAATIASKLGFGYLWIDAICIVQDNPADWLRESVKMGIIYRSAACTIASHCSDDEATGFLKAALQRRGSMKLSCQGLEGTFLRSAADLEFDVSMSPLSKRGWILQERFLSTRILHFTTGMIYLETSDGIKSEDGENPADLMQMTVNSANMLTVKQFFYRKPVTLQTFSKNLPPSHTKRQQSIAKGPSPLDWFSLVEMYSTCLLTKPEDKLIAIAGIAKLCGQSTNATYLAGMWTDHLALGLMWMCVGDLLTKPRAPRAPSWSWAAYDGPIQFPLVDRPSAYTTTCKLIDYTQTNPNQPESLTIQIELDFMDLSEALQSDLRVSQLREELHPQDVRAWDSHQNPVWNLRTDPFIRIFNIHNVHRLCRKEQFKASDSNDRSWVAFDCQTHRVNLSCASMASFKGPHGGSVLFHMVIFLVPAGLPNMYRRVGAGIIRDTFQDQLGRTPMAGTWFDKRRILLI